jgi:hypothetical protein
MDLHVLAFEATQINKPQLKGPHSGQSTDNGDWDFGRKPHLYNAIRVFSKESDDVIPDS